MDTAVYNHLITQYRPKELTKYDTHKASELRSVMNRIAKKTKTVSFTKDISDIFSKAY